MNDWDARVATVRARLAPALVMVGTWEGEGTAHGEPIRGELRVRPILDATAMEVWERVGDHEDLSIYRFEPEDGQLKVLHLMAGRVAEYGVEVTLEGMVWVTPPSEPAVAWTLQGDTLLSEVVWPDQRAPEVVIRYRRRS